MSTIVYLVHSPARNWVHFFCRMLIITARDRYDRLDELLARSPRSRCHQLQICEFLSGRVQGLNTARRAMSE